jgi:hypothetical protein
MSHLTCFCVLNNLFSISEFHRRNISHQVDDGLMRGLGLRHVAKLTLCAPLLIAYANGGYEGHSRQLK